MTTQDKDRIECAIRHIQTACDIDPWARDIAVKAMREELSKNSTRKMETCNQLATDAISRQAAIETARTMYERCDTLDMLDYCNLMLTALKELPSAQTDVPDTNVGDIINRQAAIDEIKALYEWHDTVTEDRTIDHLKRLPSAQPEPQWIPVSERLPEPRVDVWVNSDIGQIQGYYEEHIGIWYASFGQGRDYLELIVTAWMPLPEPYRAERRTDERSD